MKISDINEILSSLGVTPRKSKGQNFLLGDNRAYSIVNFAEIQADETVLEIGPGLGALTRFIAERAKKLILIEKESGFATHLTNKFSDQLGRIEILNSDIRDFKLHQFTPDDLVVISNVPYSISSEVILWTVYNRSNIKRASYLFQREFSERIAANPGTKAYGSLTVLTDIFFKKTLGDTISGKEFFPEAEVSSRLVKLTRRESPLIEVGDLGFFEKVVRSCFAMRRKTVANNLLQAKFFPDRSLLTDSLQRIGIDPSSRAETLDVFSFGRLAEELKLLS